jgi:MFS family permease
MSSASSSLTPASAPAPQKVGWLDLPHKDQLFILALCRLSEPLSNVCLLPYIFYLIQSVLQSAHHTDADAVTARNGIDADEAAQVSAYSGLLVAAFPLAQFLVSLPWGRLSDAHGRKLSIVLGLAISVVANAAFGFSRSFGALLFWRTLAGLANGNVGIMRTVTAEIVRERRFQTKAFLLLPLVFNSGMVLSLALGGFLADPAINLPWLFGPEGFFNWCGYSDGVHWVRDFPYALPALMNTAMLSVALLLSVFGLRETLAAKAADTDRCVLLGQAFVRWVGRVVLGRRSGGQYTELKDIEAESLSDTEETKEQLASPSLPPPTPRSFPLAPPSPLPPSRRALPLSSIFNQRTLAALVSFGLLPLHNAAFMHIFPVYLSTPHASSPGTFSLIAFTGGLGLPSSTIGAWLGAFGIAGILLQLFVYPRLQARLGTLGVLRISLVLFPVVYFLAPYLSLLPDAGSPGAWTRWPGLALVVCGQIMARTMAIPSTVILLTEAAPAKSVLGTVHGAGNMLASLARAVGPALGGAVFAAGVTDGVVAAVWWFYLVVVAIIALAWGFGVQRQKRDDDE